MSFKAAKELVLTRLYEKIYTDDDNEWFFADEIQALCNDAFSLVFTRKVISDLVSDQHVEATHFQDDDQMGYTITPKGISAVEKILNRDIEPAGLVSIPASDRLVSIDHNQPETEEMLLAIEAASEAIRSSNTLAEEEKSWIRKQLDAGVDLLRKAQTVTLSAVKSLILSPLGTAFKGVAEEQCKSVIDRAVQLVRAWLGF